MTAADDPPGRGAFPSTWLHGDRLLARRIGRPVQRFLAIEAAGGVLLLLAAAIALVWANSPWRASYESVFHARLSLQVGSLHVHDTITHAINDGLMALFFFVVGVEIKRELVAGELRDPRAAALPVLAALGGMVVPAGTYALANASGPGAHGWGIPMATDIAFVLGVVAVLGRRVPPPLKVFLLTLAIVDDIGAIVVIALVYSDSISLRWLAAAVAGVALVVALRGAKVRALAAYVPLGLVVWFCVYRSGVHATIAGVVLGVLVPAVPFLSSDQAEAIADGLEGRSDLSASEVRRVSFLLRESVPVTDRLIDALHPWTSYVVVPVFALANAGIALSSDALGSASAVTIGVVLGLVVGKPVGIVLFSWLAVRLRLGSPPEGVRPSQLLGAAMLAGVGFTVSLFVTGLAFTDSLHAGDAKIGTLLASVIAAIAGSVVLAAAARGRTAHDAGEE